MSDTQYDVTQTNTEELKEYLTLVVADQLFGIPVLQIQDVLGEQKVTKVPLARPEIAGSLNLRGRIVTAINLRTYLGIEKQKDNKHMSIVVEHGDDLYSLMVDRVGDVMALPAKNLEKNPGTLGANLREVSAGIYRLEDQLLVILDVSSLMSNLIIEDKANLSMA